MAEKVQELHILQQVTRSPADLMIIELNHKLTDLEEEVNKLRRRLASVERKIRD